MDIKDRGSIKWTSMMLVEHKKLLQKLYAEQDNVAKPNLSEDKLEEFDRIISRSIINNAKIKFLLHQNKRNFEIEGYIKKVDYAKRTIRLSNAKGIVDIDLNLLIDIYET